MAQLLINDAEAAIAEANPASWGNQYSEKQDVSPALTSSQKVANSEMRTAASVWAGQREEVEADPEAVVPTRGGDLGSHHQSIMR